jgi:hypothetical protein
MENLAVSNERVVKAADAVEDLRKALELWCSRNEESGSPLGVRGSASAAVDAIDKALFELHQMRRDTITEARRYDDATMARVDAMLARPRRVLPPLSYTCTEPECGQVFPVDPADPLESHGAYLDHQAEHDAEDAEDDARDKASEVDQ